MTRFAFLVNFTLWTVVASIYGPFTRDFQRFLRANPEHYSYIQNSVHRYGSTGSFGGRSYHYEKIRHEPVIFIHGNSDSALDTGAPGASGWDKSIMEFLDHGYSMKELYGITYGDRNLSLALNQVVNCVDLVGLRNFVEAILAYTRATRIDIIAHSMGVTYARRVILGGNVLVGGERCHLGEPLTQRVDALIGIAGANYGLCMCEQLSDYPACDRERGFFPGKQSLNCKSSECSDIENFDCDHDDYGTLLWEQNYESEMSAVSAPHFVVSMYSEADEILGNGLVWGRRTAVIPFSNEIKAYNNFTHDETKTKTVSDQYTFATHH